MGNREVEDIYRYIKRPAHAALVLTAGFLLTNQWSDLYIQHHDNANPEV